MGLNANDVAYNEEKEGRAREEDHKVNQNKAKESFKKRRKKIRAAALP
jgi:hypothetical protein